MVAGLAKKMQKQQRCKQAKHEVSDELLRLTALHECLCGQKNSGDIIFARQIITLLHENASP